jgi:hypothetical protein
MEKLPSNPIDEALEFVRKAIIIYDNRKASTAAKQKAHGYLLNALRILWNSSLRGEREDRAVANAHKEVMHALDHVRKASMILNDNFAGTVDKQRAYGHLLDAENLLEGETL